MSENTHQDDSFDPLYVVKSVAKMIALLDNDSDMN